MGASSVVKAENLNSWLSLGANVGVVIGLILLVVEINQNTQLTRAQMNQDRATTAMSEQQATYTSELVHRMGTIRLLQSEKRYASK